MKFSGQILKMISEIGKPIQYYINISGDLIHLNPLFKRNLRLKHIGYSCVNCGKEEKIFRMGFCKNCFFESPYASETIIRPELSTAHLGIGERDLDVEKSIQLKPHVVYLAYTGDVKVGVTRASQVPTRWIDQGATFALEIARTNNRYEAGMIEVALKERLADKTNWRKMLQHDLSAQNLEEVRKEVEPYFPADFKEFFYPDGSVLELEFPYTTPDKISSFNLDKTPEFSGVLQGIKGQYLHFEGGSFLNLRGHEGYVIELDI